MALYVKFRSLHIRNAASAPYHLLIFLCLDSVPVHFSKYLNSFSYLYCSNWLVRSAYIHDDRAFPVPHGTCSSSKLDTPTPSNLNVRSHTVRATSISQVARVRPRVLVSHLSWYQPRERVFFKLTNSSHRILTRERIRF